MPGLSDNKPVAEGALGFHAFHQGHFAFGDG